MKRYIFEAPIDDYLSKKAKEVFDTTNIKRVNKSREKVGNTNSMSEMMNLIRSVLPAKEVSHQKELIELAKSYFFYKFPQAKVNYDKGLLILDFAFTQQPIIRDTKQQITPKEIEKAESEDIDPNTGESLFKKRVKSRHLINSMTQGSAWSQGFSAFKDMEKNLNKIDNDLIELYDKFQNLATVYYSDSEESLKSMAQSSTGRIAFTDTVPDSSKPGAWRIIARAPIFPLLMHEVEKGGLYYTSKLSSPENKTVSNALTYSTDTHKHEILNMRYGKEIWGKVRMIWSEIIGNEYRNWMDSLIVGYFNELATKDPEQFNFIFLGEFDENDKPTGLGGILNMEFDEYGNPKYSSNSQEREAEEYTYELFEYYVVDFFNKIKQNYSKPENLEKNYDFVYYKNIADEHYNRDEDEKALEYYEMAYKLKQDEFVKKRIEDLKKILTPDIEEPEIETDYTSSSDEDEDDISNWM